MKYTRRQFLATTAGGILLTVTPMPLPLIHGRASQTAQAAVMKPPPDWKAGPGQARFRIDGLRKVTGQKIYARDFRARDMEGWPADEEVVLVLRTPFADRPFLGLDLEILPPDLKPTRVITSVDLARDHVSLAHSDFPAGNYLVSIGALPNYLGQAVALLYYDSYAAMERARLVLRSQDNRGLKRGLPQPPRRTDFYRPETSIIHVEGEGTEVFSQVTGGPVHPRRPGERNKQAMARVDAIRAKLEDPEAQGWKVFERTYETQVTDPMFMEPESGLGWLDPKTGTLHLVIGTQSPSYDVANAGELFSDPKCEMGVKAVNLFAAYPGGGFGGRDTSPLCLFLALAAAYARKPIRIAFDRYEQFQAGIKRHASRINLTLAVDAKGHFQAMRNHVFLNGGGRINVSSYVAQVSAIGATGPYRMPLADIWSRARHTRAPIAGSVRGFGTLQSVFAIESLVDEIANETGDDPVALRRRNVLAPDAPVVTGAPHAPPGLAEMCDQAAAHPLWKQRDRRRRASSSTPYAFGVGFALCMKNYGTGADAMLAEVSIDASGRITVRTPAIDMGTGTATTLALVTAGSLGASADDVETGILEPFDALKLEESFDKHPENPRWTPLIHESTKAASTSSKWVHGVEQASAVLLATGLLPAARDLWGTDAASIKVADVSWKRGTLTAPGLMPLPHGELARQAHAGGHVVSAMIHAFYSGRWIEADYSVANETYRWSIDALSVLHGGRQARDLIDRQNPRLFTVESIWEGNGQNFGASALLVAVEVDRRSGDVRVREGVHYLGPGRVLQQDLLEGQMDGAFAMGLGQALLEALPPYEEGAGNGNWNLNRYHVALAGDVALGHIEKAILPPESPDAPARGIAEVAMVAVAPAIGNAVQHATGVRVRALPITAEKIRKAWRQ